MFNFILRRKYFQTHTQKNYIASKIILNHCLHDSQSVIILKRDEARLQIKIIMVDFEAENRSQSRVKIQKRVSLYHVERYLSCDYYVQLIRLLLLDRGIDSACSHISFISCRGTARTRVLLLARKPSAYFCTKTKLPFTSSM